MPAYMIINADIKDPVKFAEYGRTKAALVTQFGGRNLAMAGHREILEGTWPAGKSVVSEWPTRDAALAYWHSPEYAKVKKLREGICDAQILLLDGLPGPVSDKI